MPKKIRAVTILIATDDGVAEYSYQNVRMFMDYNPRYSDQGLNYGEFMLQKPIVVDEETRFRISDVDYWKGSANRMHMQSGTPIYDQAVKELSKAIRQEIFGG